MTPLTLARQVRELLAAADKRRPWRNIILHALSGREQQHFDLKEALEIECGDDLFTWMCLALPLPTHADVLALLDRVVERMERE